MGITSKPPASSQSNSILTKTRRHAFAEAACRDAFRDRDLRLAREPEFVDRRPARLGEVVDQVVEQAGQKALSHWLDRLAHAETDAERTEALTRAERIAKKIGLPLAAFVFGRAA